MAHEVQSLAVLWGIERYLHAMRSVCTNTSGEVHGLQCSI